MMKLKAKSQNGKAKNKCTSINKRATKDYLVKNKHFWEKLKPFLPNKWSNKHRNQWWASKWWTNPLRHF